MKKIISTLLLCATVLFISCKDTIPVPVTDVKLNKGILSLVLGAKEVLVVTVNPNDADDKSVIWSSSDVAIATVSATGEVSTLKAGVTTITVTSNSNKTKKATCALTVIPAPVNVTGVILDKPTLIVTMGTPAALVSTVLPETATNKKVTWASSNVAIATVSASGVVTPVSAGEAIITVASNSDNTKSAACVVTVKDLVVNVTEVTLNKTTANVSMGATETLTATIVPTNATNKNVTWTSSNVAVATVSATGVVTPVSAGEATITATSNSDNTKKATCAVTVAVVNVTSVDLNKADLEIEMGKTATLVAKVNPTNATNKEVTWKSSDVTVATVTASGLVTPVSVGESIITVTSNADTSIKVACVVVVKAAVVNVTK